MRNVYLLIRFKYTPVCVMNYKKTYIKISPNVQNKTENAEEIKTYLHSDRMVKFLNSSNGTLSGTKSNESAALTLPTAISQYGAILNVAK